MIHNASSEGTLDAEAGPLPSLTTDVYVPHAGWLRYPKEDDVARFLREGWFEYDLQAFLSLYLRAGDLFLDCGAHAGLYSVLAGKLVGSTGAVISVEPNPAIFALLKQNLETNGVTWATPVQAALFSRRQEMNFYPGPPERLAYSSLFHPDMSAGSIRVEAITPGEISKQFGAMPAVMKIDVEGSEIEVVKGIFEAGGARNFPLLITEFTEMNLQAAGSGTEHLFRLLESGGYRICRFDVDRLKLEEVKWEGTVWHANYFAAAQPEAVNHILELASAENRRIAMEVIERGRACERLREFVDDWKEAGRPGELLQKTLAQLDDSYRKLGEANWRADHANDRAELALNRVMEAEKLAEAAVRQSNELHGLSMTLGEVRQERESLKQRLDSAHGSLRLLQGRLQELAGSRFVHLGRTFRILKAAWLDQVNSAPAIDPGPDDMDRALQHLSWKRFQPKVLLDVGAAKGSWSLRAAQVWPGARFYMIDPLTENENYLKVLSEKDTRFHYLQTAVGDAVSDLVMNVTPDYDGSSLLSWAGEDPNRQRRISVTTLDQLMAEGRLAPPNLVKIDVQGFELKVLKGAQRIFESAEIFIVEVNLYEFMRGCPRVHELVAFFAERGFYLFDIAGTLRRPFDNNLAQMDLVLASSASTLADSNRWT